MQDVAAVQRVFEIVANRHKPLGLIVGIDSRRINGAVQKIGAQRQWPEVRISGPLAEQLRDVAPESRPQAAEDWLRAEVNERSPGPIVCTEIDLLFEPTLSLNPLTLLERSAAICALVVAWSGAFDGTILSYAVPEHGHYRIWRDPNAEVAVLKT